MGGDERKVEGLNLWGKRDRVREVWLLQEEKEKKFSEMGKLSGV